MGAHHEDKDAEPDKEIVRDEPLEDKPVDLPVTVKEEVKPSVKEETKKVETGKKEQEDEEVVKPKRKGTVDQELDDLFGDEPMPEKEKTPEVKPTEKKAKPKTNLFDSDDEDDMWSSKK